MKAEICNFSGYKIYPGHGIKFVRGDARTFTFISKKCTSYFHMKRNPRKINWTVVYRRVHKKGAVEDVKRRRARKTQKAQRAIVGASLDVIKARASQTKEVRQANREAALRKVKEERKKKQASKAKKVDSSAQKAQRRAQNKASKKVSNKGR